MQFRHSIVLAALISVHSYCLGGCNVTFLQPGPCSSDDRDWRRLITSHVIFGPGFEGRVEQAAQRAWVNTESNS